MPDWMMDWPYLGRVKTQLESVRDRVAVLESQVRSLQMSAPKGIPDLEKKR